jgi:DNA-binding MurR/RpiR family transcriptional regulator
MITVIETTANQESADALKELARAMDGTMTMLQRNGDVLLAIRLRRAANELAQVREIMVSGFRPRA